MVDTFIEACVKIVGLLLVIIMIIGLFMAFLMALSLLDYIFDTNMKQSLTNKIPHWSVLFKLRQYIVAKADHLDQTIIAQDISNQSAITNKSNSEAAQKHES